MKLKQPRKRIAYIVSRFPKITETFILFEILELERLGTEVSVFSILRENEGIMHAEAAPVVERAHYCNACLLAGSGIATVLVTALAHRLSAFLVARSDGKRCLAQLLCQGAVHCAGSRALRAADAGRPASSTYTQIGRRIRHSRPT